MYTSICPWHLPLVFPWPLRCCMSWRVLRHTARGTMEWGRSPRRCSLTGFLYCLYIHHSYTHRGHDLRYLMPIQIWNLYLHDPTTIQYYWSLLHVVFLSFCVAIRMKPTSHSEKFSKRVIKFRFLWNGILAWWSVIKLQINRPPLWTATLN